MAASDYKLIRFGAQSREGDSGWIAFEVDTSSQKLLQFFAVAGSSAKLEKLQIGSSYDEFMQAWQEVQYYNHYNKDLTMDYKQLTKRLAASLDFISQLFRALEQKKFNDLQFQIQSELEHIMGTHNLQVQVDVAGFAKEDDLPKDIKPPPSKQRLMPMKFVLSPFSGVMIPRLAIPQKIYANFADLKDKQTRQYIKQQGMDVQTGAAPQVVTLRGLDQIPKTNSIRALVELADGTQAEIIEDSYLLKVKTLESSRKKGKRNSGDILADIQNSGPGFLVLLGIVVLASVLIGIIMTLALLL